MARGKCYKTFFTFIKKFLFDLLDYLSLENIKILVEYLREGRDLPEWSKLVPHDQDRLIIT